MCSCMIDYNTDLEYQMEVPNLQCSTDIWIDEKTKHKAVICVLLKIHNNLKIPKDVMIIFSSRWASCGGLLCRMSPAEGSAHLPTGLRLWLHRCHWIGRQMILCVSTYFLFLFCSRSLASSLFRMKTWSVLSKAESKWGTATRRTSESLYPPEYPRALTRSLIVFVLAIPASCLTVNCVHLPYFPR